MPDFDSRSLVPDIGGRERAAFLEQLARGADNQGVYNFKPSNTAKWRTAMAKVRAGAGSAKILNVGDSTTFGQGAGTGASGTIGARAKSYPVFLATILTGMGLPAHSGSICGNGGLTDTDFLAYDPRLALGAGWAQSVITSLATRTWLNSSTVNPLTFTPAQAFDTIEIWYLQNAGYATFTVGVDGGAPLQTINAAGAQALVKATVTCPAGTHAINIARNGTGGSLHITAINTLHSAAAAVSVIGAGWSGSAASSWDLISSPWSPGFAIPAIGADLTIINLGINNWRGTPPVDFDTFTTQYQSSLSRAKTTGDVIILGPVPSAYASANPQQQADYMAALYALAASNDVPLIDMTKRFRSYADANALGFYFDQLHPTGIGYADEAQFIARTLLAA